MSDAQSLVHSPEGVHSASPHTHRAPDGAVPPCRGCGSAKQVASYPPGAPKMAICPDCCETAEHPDGETGHQFTYARYEGHTCDYCGINRNDTAYDDGGDE